MPVQIDRRKLQEVSSLELFARQVVEGFIVGMHKSPFHGFSVEFAEHRQYNPGDSTRHIDWKLYGRSEKLYLKKYEEETNLRARLIIDTSSSMYYPEEKTLKDGKFNKIKFSVYAAAALTELFRRQRDAVGLSLFSETLGMHTECKTSVTHHRFLYERMEELLLDEQAKKNSGTDLVQALHEIAEQTHRRSLVVLFSDMLDGEQSKSEALFEAMQHLRHNKHEVILFHVHDARTEMEFEFENRPYTFVDPETGEELKVQPGEVKESYVKAVKAHMEEIKLRCSQYHIDFITADIQEGFNKVLISYLTKRSSMK
jgi:uncharacterized protein (DUF58 family)